MDEEDIKHIEGEPCSCQKCEEEKEHLFKLYYNEWFTYEKDKELYVRP
jgi:hypothetical protein